jgi:hypothetical protein
MGVAQTYSCLSAVALHRVCFAVQIGVAAFLHIRDARQKDSGLLANHSHRRVQ